MPVTNPVTLILGAGASKPYGFPMGRTLVARTLAMDPSSTARQLAVDKSLIRDLQKALGYSLSDSIDAFLETRENFLEVGKAIIAVLLIPMEEPTDAWIKDETSPRWYDYLWKMVRTHKVEDFKANRLRIVTYNYDRSLEFALLRAIQNTYGVSDGEAADLLRLIPIVHVHGTLGQLPELAPVPDPRLTRKYSPELTQNDIAVAGRCIKISHENIDDTPELQRARDLMKDSSAVVFLGFGYHRRNVERLRLHEHLQKANIHGTLGAEITLSEIRTSIQPLFSALRRDQVALFANLANRCSDALTFLKNHRHLFTS
jgi:hypothetical protein